MFYIYICLYKNLSYLIKTIPPPFLLPQRSRILGLDTISGSSGFLAPLTLGLGPNTMRGNSALLSTMPCRDRPAIEQCLSQFPHAPQILRDEGKLCPPSSPWILTESILYCSHLGLHITCACQRWTSCQGSCHPHLNR